jgi:hypothetical protein
VNLQVRSQRVPDCVALINVPLICCCLTH